jgi:hypothetical protein
MHGAVFEVKRGRVEDVGAKFIPRFGFRENGMAQCARTVATFLSVANFED